MTYAHTQGSASNRNWKYGTKIETKYQPAITSKATAPSMATAHTPADTSVRTHPESLTTP